MSVVVIESLENRRLLSAVTWDGGGDGQLWSDPLNWSGDVLPGVEDDVTIDLGDLNPLIRIRGTVHVASLTSHESLLFERGTLTLDQSSLITGNFEQRGGTALDGAGDLRITGTASILTKESAGFIQYAGSGTLELAGEATIDIAYSTLRFTHSRTLLVSGTTILTKSHPFHYTSHISISPEASIDVTEGGTLIFDKGASAREASIYAGAAINNSGRIIKTGGLESNIDAYLRNSAAATVEVHSGNLWIEDSASPFGTGHTTDDVFSNGTYLIKDGGTLGIFPLLEVLSTTVEIEAGGSATGLRQLKENRGTLRLNEGASLTITPAGGTFLNSGSISIAPNAHLQVDGDLSLNATTGEPEIHVELDANGNFGRLNISNSLRLDTPGLDGRLEVTLVDDADPAVGSRFDVLQAADIYGGFDTFTADLTASGLALAATRPSQQVLAIEVFGSHLPLPEVAALAFEYQTTQALSLFFNQDVGALLARDDVFIENLSLGNVLPDTVGLLSFDASLNRATLLLTSQLEDGNYRVTLDPSDLANAAGHAGTGPLITFDFYVLAGDANRDRVVDVADLGILASNFRGTGKTFSQGDFNYDGVVDVADLGILASNFRTTLAMPAMTQVHPPAVRTPAFSTQPITRSVLDEGEAAEASVTGRAVSARPAVAAKPPARSTR